MNPVTEAAFLDELEKIAAVPGGPGLLSRAGSAISGAAKGAGGWLHHMENPIEVAGLGALAAPSVDNMIAKHRARKAGLVDAAGKPTEEGVESKRFIKDKYHDAIEAGGLGALAMPILGKRLSTGNWR